MIEKNQECDIVSDLLPLYLEEKTGKESNEFIKAHLEYCKECRKKLEYMEASYQELFAGNGGEQQNEGKLRNKREQRKKGKLGEKGTGGRKRLDGFRKIRGRMLVLVYLFLLLCFWLYMIFVLF